MDCSPPGSSGRGVLQARILEWIAIPFSRGSSRPRDQNRVSCIAGRFFTVWVLLKPGVSYRFSTNLPTPYLLLFIGCQRGLSLAEWFFQWSLMPSPWRLRSWVTRGRCPGSLPRVWWWALRMRAAGPCLPSLEQAVSGFCTWGLFQKKQEKTIPNEQIPFRFPLVFCWPKQVIWPRPDSEDGETQTPPLNGQRCEKLMTSLCNLT